MGFAEIESTIETYQGAVQEKKWWVILQTNHREKYPRQVRLKWEFKYANWETLAAAICFVTVKYVKYVRTEFTPHKTREVVFLF